ncbi:MAG: universal stress protein [Planctomycetes bacterium]|nr:universal stress protein [Planctomycetota bacterium]
MSIRKILVPTDFSPNSYLAVEAANALATRFGAEITLFYVEATHDYLVLDIGSTGAREEREFEMHHFDEAKELVSSDVECHTMVDKGTPYEAILAAAESRHADLIVIATHAHSGIQRFLLGSTTEKVVRGAKCPVLLVHPDPDRSPARMLVDLEKIVVPTDLSDTAKAALPVAAEIAKSCDAELLLTHVIEPLTGLGFGTGAEQVYALQRGLQEATSEGLTKFRSEVPDGVKSEVVVLEGTAHDELAGLVDREKAGLIVMATHGHTGVTRWLLGSVTDRVSRTATCPLLIVPPS